MRGRHPLPIADFYAATDAQLFSPARAGTGASWTQAPGSAWPHIFQNAIRYPDEHGPKIARALADFAARWGLRAAPGFFAVSGAAPLEGIERLDGTLFVRVAGLTFDRLGWVDEGEKAMLWGRDGFPSVEFDDDASKVSDKFTSECVS